MAPAPCPPQPGCGASDQPAQALRIPDRHASVAVHRLLLATGLMPSVLLRPSGSFSRNLGDMLIVAALVIQHRGMVLYRSRQPSDCAYVALLAATLSIIAASFTQANGHGLRVAVVCVGLGTMVLATVLLIWCNGCAAMPSFSAIVAGGYGICALSLFARAVQAMSVGAQTKISIDAPGHSNVPLAILVMFIGGMVNQAQIRLVLGRVFQRLTAQALTDPLTGTVNRCGLMSQMKSCTCAPRTGAMAMSC